MEIEAVEQKTLSYLKQVTNPLVPISRLLRHLHQDEALAALNEKELLEFLRDHELFNIIETAGIGMDLVAPDDLAEAGVSMEPRVILCTRVPTREQLSEQISAEFDNMVQALNAALTEAKDEAHADRVRAIMKLLDRAGTLRDHLKELL
jgi:hypothetical protein